MARPTGRKRATDEQDMKAQELKAAYGTFREAVRAYVTEMYRPQPGLDRGETFTTLDIAKRMEVHRDHVSGSISRWDDSEFDLVHENKTHYHLERKERKEAPPQQPPWTPPQSSPGGLSEVPAYILQRYTDTGSLMIWLDGQLYLAKPINFEV